MSVDVRIVISPSGSIPSKTSIYTRHEKTSTSVYHDVSTFDLKDIHPELAAGIGAGIFSVNTASYSKMKDFFSLEVIAPGPRGLPDPDYLLFLGKTYNAYTLSSMYHLGDTIVFREYNPSGGSFESYLLASLDVEAHVTQELQNMHISLHQADTSISSTERSRISDMCKLSADTEISDKNQMKFERGKQFVYEYVLFSTTNTGIIRMYQFNTMWFLQGILTGMNWTGCNTKVVAVYDRLGTRQHMY